MQERMVLQLTVPQNHILVLRVVLALDPGFNTIGASALVCKFAGSE